jgi:single-strand DNA-binding protein
MYLNSVTLIGNLTRDPELKDLGATKVANFGLATNRTWKDKDGQKKEEVEFHNCVAFGRQAETIAQYMKKGSQLLVEGRLKTSTWDDKESGKKMYKTEIMIDKSQFGNKNAAVSSDPAIEEAEAAKKAEIERRANIEVDINPDDIPF